MLEGEPLAIPLNVLRFHEIANLTRATKSIAVTFCPLLVRLGGVLPRNRAVGRGV